MEDKIDNFVDITGKLEKGLVDYSLSSNCAPVLNLFLQTQIFQKVGERKAHLFDTYKYICEENGIKVAKDIEIKSNSELTIEHFNLLVGLLNHFNTRQEKVLKLSSTELNQVITKTKTKYENKQLDRLYQMLLEVAHISFIVKSYVIVNDKVNLNKPDSIQSFSLFDSVEVDTHSVNGSVAFSAVSLSVNKGIVEAYREQGHKVIRMDLLNRLSRDYSKALYRYLVAVYNGTSNTLKVERNDLYSVLGLDSESISTSNQKIKQALSQLEEQGIVKRYKITKGRSYIIDIDRKVFHLNGQETKEEIINEALSNEDKAQEFDVDSFLNGL